MPRNDPSYASSSNKAPVGRRRSGFDWLPFLALVLAVVLAVSFVPGIRGQLDSLIAKPVDSRMISTVTVWANKQTGNYYCAGSREYAKGQGRYMKQGEALTAGYQPELGRYCNRVTAARVTERSR